MSNPMPQPWAREVERHSGYLHTQPDKSGEDDWVQAEIYDALLAHTRELEAALKEAVQREERLTDLVRHQRHELHDADLISDDEFAALLADSDGGKRVARLEGYDAIRRELAASPSLWLQRALEAVQEERLSRHEDCITMSTEERRKENLPDQEHAYSTAIRDAEQAIQKLIDEAAK